MHSAPGFTCESEIFVRQELSKIMTTIEICNSYQTSITVTAIFSFIAGMLLCEKNLLSDFFFCEGSPLFESKIKNRRCL